MKDKFEQYWQEKFASFEVKPNESVWFKLNNALFEKQTQSLFNRFMLEPSKAVWRNIALVLWWKQFVRFSYTHFNIYYLSFFILLLLSFIFSISKKESLSISQSQNNNQINTTRTASAFLNKTRQHNIFQQTQSDFNLNKKNQEKPINQESLTSFEFINLPKSTSRKVDSLKYAYSDYFMQEREVLAYQPKGSNSIGFTCAPSLQQHTWKLLTREETKRDKYFELLNNQSFAMGLWFKHTFNVLEFETGLMYQSTKQYYAYNNPIFTVDSIETFDIYDNSYYQYSYIQILNLDTLLLTGDTVWIYHIDSTLVSVIDTVYNTQIKEIRKDRRATHHFSYKTLEIPFLLGYTQRLDRFLLTLKAGLSLSYSVLIVGTLPSNINDYGNVTASKEYFKWLHLNSLAAIEAQFLLNEQWSVSVMPMYKRSLTNLLNQNYPAQLKSQSWMFHVGLKYNIK